MTEGEEVRFGILADGPIVPAWQARCIEEILRLTYVRPPCLIVAANEPRGSRRLHPNRMGGALFRAYAGLLTPAALRPVDLSTRLAGIPPIRLGGGDPGDSLRERDLDLVLRLSTEGPPRPILEAARHGVWSFEFGDPARSRGEPPGLWEVDAGDPITRADLLQTTAGAEAALVLRSGAFRTALHSWKTNASQVLFGVRGWAASAVRELHEGGRDPLVEAARPPRGIASRGPTNLEAIRLLTRQTGYAIRRIDSGLRRHEEWSLGIVDRPIAAFLDPVGSMPIRWLRPPGGRRFTADPFGAHVDGVLTILYEDFDYRTAKGVIATINSSARGPATPPKVALPLPVHASYPYLFEYDGSIVCVPETHEAREVSAYRALEFPDRWEKMTTIIRGPAALDPTVFQRSGRWWLTFTDLDAGQYVHLFAWYADRLEGPWTPHRRNPVKSDVRSSRPAGTPFVHEGALYRPAQDCSRTYGGGITLNRVLRLTPDEFIEEPAALIAPFSGSPFPDGLHTISSVGDVTLIDAKRHRFIPAAIPYVLRGTRPGRIR